MKSLKHQLSLLLKTTLGLALVITTLWYLYDFDKFSGFILALYLLSLAHAHDTFFDWVRSPSSKIISWLNKSKTSSGNKNTRKALRVLFYVLAIIFFCSIFYVLSLISQGYGFKPYDSQFDQIVYFATSLIIFYYSLFAMRTLEETSKSDNKFIKWYRGLSYFALYSTLVFGLLNLSALASNAAQLRLILSVTDLGQFLAFFYLAALNFELLLRVSRNLLNIVSNRKKDTSLDTPFFVDFVASDKTLRVSLVKSFSNISGIDLSKSEIAGFIGKSIEPICIISVLILWLLSSIVIVAPDRQGIVTRFGQVQNREAIKPGLHFKLPWPFSSVQLYDAYRVKVLNIGFEPDPDQPHIIWSKEHALEYFDLVTGNGEEIIAIDCQVYYKINNLYKYLYNCANSDQLLTMSAYNLLTQEASSSNFDNLITIDRESLSKRIENALQKIANDNKIGVDIVDVVFVAMHPPLEVTDAFEDVISAQTQRYTFQLEARTESSFKLSMNKAMAANRINEAYGFAFKKLSEARGYRESLLSQNEAYQIDPQLARFRLSYDSMQKVLSGRELFIFDKSIMQNEDRLFLNIE